MELILNRINGYGIYQKLIHCLLGLFVSLAGVITYSNVFVIANQELVCTNANERTMQSENCDAWENLIQNPNLSNSYTCEFSRKYYDKTLVNEWGFQCSKIYLASFVTTAFILGTLLSFMGGFIGDKYGRRTTCIISLVIICLSSVISEILITKFSLDVNTKYLIYLVAQFFLGLFSK